MSTPNQTKCPNQLDRISEIIRSIEGKSENSDYIYRGESKYYEKVTSSLYREYIDVKAEHFDIEAVQAEILSEAKNIPIKQTNVKFLLKFTIMVVKLT